MEIKDKISVYSSKIAEILPSNNPNSKYDYPIFQYKEKFQKEYLSMVCFINNNLENFNFRDKCKHN